MTTIVWFRQDLRLRDNPALHAAAALKEPVIPLYVWSPDEEGAWPPGAASRWWLHHSLSSLGQELAGRGSRLLLANGPAAAVIDAIAAQVKATAVHYNGRYEPDAKRCETALAAKLSARGVKVRRFNSALLREPDSLLNTSGQPYRVYTAFQNRLRSELEVERPLSIPATLPPPESWPQSLQLSALNLLPKRDWYETIAATWTPGESGALARVERFLRSHLSAYSEQRDIPSSRGTSRLSPHLHYGEVGPRQLWHALGSRNHSSVFARELLWREFAYHLLHHFPHTTAQSMRAEFAQFPWEHDEQRLRAWQRGLTGVPLVDAGMRELWATGWMHNRVRMVVASMLVKNLLVPWQDGARWFWDTLVDADLAANTMNWQWVAGCGADAAPYFRIFNPITQAERFDPDGRYVRQWISELNETGSSYPASIVDLARTRRAALRAYELMRSEAADK